MNIYRFLTKQTDYYSFRIFCLILAPPWNGEKKVKTINYPFPCKLYIVYITLHEKDINSITSDSRSNENNYKDIL